MEEAITSFASHLFLIGISIFVLIGLMMINLLMTENQNAKTTEFENIHEINQKSNLVQTKYGVVQYNSSSTSTINKLRSAKILFSIILFFALMTLGSLYYVRNMGVYYVVLQNDLSPQKADYLMQTTNKSFESSGLGLSTRILELPNYKYELILRNGYISEQKADSDLEKVKSLKLAFVPYKVGPQKVANYFRKIKYIQHHIFN